MTTKSIGPCECCGSSSSTSSSSSSSSTTGTTASSTTGTTVSTTTGTTDSGDCGGDCIFQFECDGDSGQWYLIDDACTSSQPDGCACLANCEGGSEDCPPARTCPDDDGEIIEGFEGCATGRA